MKRDKVYCEFPVSAVKGKGQAYKDIECARDRLSSKTYDNLGRLRWRFGIDWEEVYFVEVKQETRDFALGRMVKSLKKTKRHVKRHSVVIHGIRRHWFKANEEFWYVRRETKAPASGQTILYKDGKKIGRVNQILAMEDINEDKKFSLSNLWEKIKWNASKL